MSANTLLSRVKDITSRVVDSFLPIPEEDEYEEEELQEQHAEQIGANQEWEARAERRVANGGTVSFATSSYETSSTAGHTPSEEGHGTQLTVHTTKVAELRVRIHRLRRYDDAAPAVVQLKKGIAVAVNFDCMNEPERRRACDFLNGACYVLHGTARVVSSTIVLYAPKGIDVTEVTPKTM